MYKPLPESLKNTTDIKYNFFYWGPFLFHTKITPEECQIILKEGKKCRIKSNDYRSKLAGHLSEAYKITNEKRIIEWLKKYFNAYAHGYDKWTGGGYMSPDDFKLTSLWINYMKANEFNPPHPHPTALSFVIYPDVPQKITKEHKEFEERDQGAYKDKGAPGGISWLYGQGNRQCITVIHRMPETRDLFIFPAGLQHWVFPFKSNVERVSVSGNILFDQDPRSSNYP